MIRLFALAGSPVASSCPEELPLCSCRTGGGAVGVFGWIVVFFAARRRRDT